ncbi:MAG: hypothetical protein H7A35_14355 [Planctomycetales bacterium]|nr:hypothetical protein [bacterium]UNM08018.1 MAG: hypothetical protein H7A35_14355 [Planctomycetales bacterium]
MLKGRLGQLAATAMGLLLIGGCGGGSTLQQANADYPATLEAPAGTGLPHTATGPVDIKAAQDLAADQQTNQAGTDQQLLSNLSDMLGRELSAAGKDISATQTKAPSGVYLRYAGIFAYEMQGEVPDSPVAAELLINEYQPGDYDGNGVVNSSDLVPLAQHWGSTLNYTPVEIPGAHGDYPDDYALGRIDGNLDGVINAADITVIAQHWLESLDGYRIYVSRDGEPEELLLDPFFPESGLSISRNGDYPAAVGLQPGSLSYALAPDTRPVGIAVYSYVTVLDALSDWSFRFVAVNLQADEPEAPSYHFDFPRNQPPVLEYSIELSEDSAPSLLSVDFSGSSDDDGSSLNQRCQLYSESGELLFDKELNSNKGKVLVVPLYDAGDYRIVLSLQDSRKYLSAAEELIPLQSSRVTLDSGWSVTHTSLFEPVPGMYNIRADLQEISGNPAIVHIVGNGSGAFQAGYLRSLDASGNSWPPVQDISSVLNALEVPDNPNPYISLLERDGLPVLSLFALPSGIAFTGNLHLLQSELLDGSGFTAGPMYKALVTYGLDVVGDRLWLSHVGGINDDGNLDIEKAPGSMDFTNTVFPQSTNTFMPGRGQRIFRLDSSQIAISIADNGQKLNVRTTLAPDARSWSDATEIDSDISLYGCRYQQDGNRIVFLGLQSFTGEELNAGSPGLEYSACLAFAELLPDGDSWTLNTSCTVTGPLDAGSPKSVVPGLFYTRTTGRLALLEQGKPVVVYVGRDGSIRYMKSGTADGTGFGDPVILDIDNGEAGISPLDCEEVGGKVAILAIDNATGELLYISQD